MKMVLAGLGPLSQCARYLPRRSTRRPQVDGLYEHFVFATSLAARVLSRYRLAHFNKQL